MLHEKSRDGDGARVVKILADEQRVARDPLARLLIAAANSRQSEMSPRSNSDSIAMSDHSSELMLL